MGQHQYVQYRDHILQLIKSKVQGMAATEPHSLKNSKPQSRQGSIKMRGDRQTNLAQAATKQQEPAAQTKVVFNENHAKLSSQRGAAAKASRKAKTANARTPASFRSISNGYPSAPPMAPAA